MQAGKQKSIFDTSNLPPGIFFCRMQMGEKVVTKKIIKIK
jgi:uncharacterized membrane-anchored protein